MDPTETPTPIWPTPTPWPVSGEPPAFDIDANAALVNFAETSVQGWNTTNSTGILDDVMTLLILIILILIIKRIITSLRTRSNAQ